MTKSVALPDRARLHALFDYDPLTGLITHKVNGLLATVKPNKDGYLRLWVDGKAYLAHRIIFFMVYGLIPNRVDHEDTNTSNNRLRNLRDADTSKNGANRKPKPGKTLPKGVTFSKRTGKFVAQIMVNRKNYGLGYFKTPELAAEAYRTAAIKHFGEFART